jgi:hypothetical protein
MNIIKTNHMLIENPTTKMINFTLSELKEIKIQCEKKLERYENYLPDIKVKDLKSIVKKINDSNINNLVLNHNDNKHFL